MFTQSADCLTNYCKKGQLLLSPESNSTNERYTLNNNHKQRQTITMGSRIFRAKILALQTNLLNFAYTLTSNRDDAYDLLQDTTLKALTSEDKYVDNINFKGWIFTIMRNLFINNYRKQMRSVVVVDQSDDLYQLNASASVTDNPEDSLNTREIHDAISAIPQEYGEPLSLFISGYHYDEIAKRMALPLGTVKSRIFQARKRLQSKLSDIRYE